MKNTVSKDYETPEVRVVDISPVSVLLSSPVVGNESFTEDAGIVW